MNSMHNLILASNSPRRQELLKQAGYHFQVVVYDFEEHIPSEIQSEHAAQYLAEEKNKFYRSKLENQVIITADTTVVVEDQVLNKAADKSEARNMLRTLSGKTHQVISGVCISNLKKSISISESTEVTFDTITEREANFYIDKFQPFDKAGAYGIQEWIGMTQIDHISGSYFNVVGLPIKKLYDKLKTEFGISPMD